MLLLSTLQVKRQLSFLLHDNMSGAFRQSGMFFFSVSLAYFHAILKTYHQSITSNNHQKMGYYYSFILPYWIVFGMLCGLIPFWEVKKKLEIVEIIVQK